MVLYFITDSRFGKSAEAIYNLNGSLGDSLWTRYLEHFDKIVVVARILQNAPVNTVAPQTTDPRVSFLEIPYFMGPFQFMCLRSKIKELICASIRNDVAFICRIPGVLGNLVIGELRKKNIKYAVEVVGDPKNSLSYSATRKVIPAILSLFLSNTLKRNVYNATAALYVTNETLQRIYPVKKGSFSIGVSDVVVDTRMTSLDVRPFPEKGCIELLSIGSLEQMYKAPDIVLKALKILKDQGVDYHFTWLGDGKYRDSMIKLSCLLGIAEEVTFAGSVSKEEVNNYLRRSDAYIQASRTEGLPRALIEAMAVGLPCVGTRVGGIPELLADEYLIEVDDFKRLASIIIRFANDSAYVNMSKEGNFIKAQKFNTSELKEKRDLFFLTVKQMYK